QQSRGVTHDAESPRRGESASNHSPRRERRHDQRGEHEIYTDELDGHGDGKREQYIEPDAAEALAAPEPESQNRRVNQRRPYQPALLYPEDLPDEQIAQMLAAVHVAC